MHFKPPSQYWAHQRLMGSSCARTRPYNHTRKMDMPTPAEISIDGNKIDEVLETKFLGVTIDSRLTWLPHIDNLHKKLKSVTGILNRIKNEIPSENYKALYHALFESHLSYCLTVFGGVGSTHLEKVFRTQKHAIRLLFGDHEAYLEKSKTCARAREFGKQVLGPEYYSKEHTKNLFTKHKILAFTNIYEYQCSFEIFKILKFGTPVALLEMLTPSLRNCSLRLLLPPLSGDFIHRGSKLWNTAIQALKLDGHISSIQVGSFKNRLKTALLATQAKFGNEWHQYNFKLKSVLRQ